MKSGIGDRSLGLSSGVGEPALEMLDGSGEQIKAKSNLYFAKSRKHLIGTIDARRFAVDEVTLIHLSFTNIGISIALPGGSVSLEGGASRIHSLK